MMSFIQYQCKSYFRSLTFIPPFVLFFAWVIIFYTYRGVPILSSYAVTSTTLFIIVTWVTKSLFSLEEVGEKELLFVQLKKKQRYLNGKWIVAVLVSLLLTIYAVFYPIIIHSFQDDVQFYHMVFAFYTHLSLSLFGICVGSLVSILPLHSEKLVWLLATFIVIVSIAQEGIAEAYSFLGWLLLMFPPLPRILTYLEDSIGVDMSTSFLLDSGFVILYLLLAFILLSSLFRRKES